MKILYFILLLLFGCSDIQFPWKELTFSEAQIAAMSMAIFSNGMISEEILSQLTLNRSGRYLYDYLHPYSGGIPSG